MQYTEYTWIFVLATIFSFICAFGIGANDLVSQQPSLHLLDASPVVQKGCVLGKESSDGSVLTKLRVCNAALHSDKSWQCQQYAIRAVPSESCLEEHHDACGTRKQQTFWM